MNKWKECCYSHKHGKAEVIAFLLYVIGITVVTYFHEPWFDEAQAWDIARSASYHDILFAIPHYEGHPQLWHLWLSLFARAGMPYKLSLYIAHNLFMFPGIALILWRSPFPKMLRCTIPFTYFIFYQYGVLSRPYSMLFLFLILAAMCYPKRDQHPIRYILTLTLICCTSAYGMVTACGLCIVWTVEIILEYRKKRIWKKIFTDIRPYLLLAILILALLILSCIFPAKDCYYDGHDNGLKERAENLRFIILLPLESLFGNYVAETTVSYTNAGLVLTMIGGVIMWIVLIMLVHANHKKAVILVPYSLIVLTISLVFCATHHFGISTLFLLFGLWVIYGDNGKLIIPPVFKKIYEKLDTKIIRCTVISVLCIIGLLPVCYSVYSSVLDVYHKYAPTEIADFIKENHLEDKKIMIGWAFDFNVNNSSDALHLGLELNSSLQDETLPTAFPELTQNIPNVNGLAVTTLPYFDNNFIMNFNADHPDRQYTTWKMLDDNTPLYALWRKQGLPDVIIGVLPLYEVYSEEELEGITYDWVDTIEYGKIFKTQYNYSEVKVYLRSDLLDEYPQFEKQTYAQKAKEPD